MMYVVYGLLIKLRNGRRAGEARPQIVLCLRIVSVIQESCFDLPGRRWRAGEAYGVWCMV